MTRYEIWKKADVGQSRGKPVEGPFYVIDTGIEVIKQASKGTYKSSVWNGKSHPHGAYEDVELPNTLVLIERGDRQSSIRGFGIGGKWYAAVDCKRCQETGMDPNHYGMICKSCNGAGFKHKV